MTDTGTLAAALARVQTKLPEIRKSEIAQVKSDKGSYSYTYANLAGISAQIMPLLGAEGLSFIARPTWSGERFVLAYSLMHESGERENGEYPLPTGGTPQALGSAITYGRRYCLCAVTGVAPDDDDDDGAAAQAEAAKPKGAAKSPAAPRQNDQISEAQARKLHVSFKDRHIDERAARLAYAANVIGRQVESSSELTKREAGDVIDALETGITFPDLPTQNHIPDVPDPWQAKS